MAEISGGASSMEALANRSKSLTAAVIVMVVYIFLRWNTIDIPLNRDEGGFAYLGELIWRGATLYVDGVDLKPPGIFFLYAGLKALGIPFTAKGLHWALFAYNFGTLVILVLLARLLFGGNAAFWTALSYAVVSSSRQVEGFNGSTEMFLLLPVVGSLLLAVMSVRGRERRRSYLAYFSGFLAACAFWIKQPSLFVSAFTVAFVIYECSFATTVAKRNSPGSVGCAAVLGWFVSGAISVTVMVMAYFILVGAWEEFLFWSLLHPLEYSNQHSGDIYFQSFLAKVLWLSRENPTIWLTASAACLWALWRNRDEGLFITGFLAASVLAAANSARMYNHYFAVACPAAALAVGWGLNRLVASAESRNLLRRAALVASFVLVAVIPVVLDLDYYVRNSPAANCRKIFGSNPFPESQFVAQYLRDRTRSDDHILILGSEPQVLVLADRLSATRHIYMYPVVGPYDKASELQSEVVTDIQRTRPKYAVFVDLRTSWLPNPLHSGDFLRWVYKTLDTEFETEAAVALDSESRELMVGKTARERLSDSKEQASLVILRNKSSGKN